MSIWRIKTNGKSLDRVTTVHDGFLAFTASANGSVIALGAGSESCRSGVTSVVIEDLKTDKTHRIEASALRDESNPLALSPNGTLAVVTTARESDPQTNSPDQAPVPRVNDRKRDAHSLPGSRHLRRQFPELLRK